MQTVRIAARISLFLLCAPLLQAQEPSLPKPAIPGMATAPAPKGDLKPVAVKKSDEPPPLQALAQTVTSARTETISLRNFNGLARTLSIPEHPESQGTIYAANQTIDGVLHSIMVRRMTDPERTDIIVFAVRNGTMHIFHTGPDGLLQTALQRTQDRTTTTVSGRDVDTAFRGEIQNWQTWRESYLRQLADNSRRSPQK